MKQLFKKRKEIINNTNLGHFMLSNCDFSAQELRNFLMCEGSWYRNTTLWRHEDETLEHENVPVAHGFSQISAARKKLYWVLLK